MADTSKEAVPVAWGESYDGGAFFNTVSLTKTKHHTYPLYAHPAPLRPAPQPEGQIMDGWVDDKTFIEPLTPATPTAQEVVPTEDELDEAWKSGFNAGFGEARLTAHPPQPSVSVAEAETNAECRKMIAGFMLECNAIGHIGAAENLVRSIKQYAALRALKGGEANG